jgi:hypothetical protein
MCVVASRKGEQPQPGAAHLVEVHLGGYNGLEVVELSVLSVVELLVEVVKDHLLRPARIPRPFERRRGVTTSEPRDWDRWTGGGENESRAGCSRRPGRLHARRWVWEALGVGCVGCGGTRVHLDDAQRVIGVLMVVLVELLEDVLRHVVERVRRDHLCPPHTAGQPVSVTLCSQSTHKPKSMPAHIHVTSSIPTAVPVSCLAGPPQAHVRPLGSAGGVQAPRRAGSTHPPWSRNPWGRLC